LSRGARVLLFVLTFSAMMVGMRQLDRVDFRWVFAAYLSVWHAVHVLQSRFSIGRLFYVTAFTAAMFGLVASIRPR
jgi:hypothetical protein